MAKLRVKGGVPEWCIEHMIFCQCFSGSLMILFMRDDCGPIEMVNKTSFASKLERKKKTVPKQCPAVDGGTQVGDRELQVTTETLTGTTAMTVRVDLGSLRAASATWSTET